MAYVKNIADPPGWQGTDLVTPARMDNFETIYTEASSYLTSHNHDSLYQTKTEMEATYWYAGNAGPGSGADADFVYKSTGNMHAAAFAGLGIPTGLIVLWYGAIGDIPSGWQLANGTGTIDLRNQFPVGAGSVFYSVGDTGGSVSFTPAGQIDVAGHALTTSEMAGHVHPFADACAYSAPMWDAAGSNICAVGTYTYGNTASAGSGSAHGHTSSSFAGNAANSMPFGIALCYIQKL